MLLLFNEVDDSFPRLCTSFVLGWGVRFVNILLFFKQCLKTKLKKQSATGLIDTETLKP